MAPDIEYVLVHVITCHEAWVLTLWHAAIALALSKHQGTGFILKFFPCTGFKAGKECGASKRSEALCQHYTASLAAMCCLSSEKEAQKLQNNCRDFLSPGGVVELGFLMTVISVNVQLNCFWFLRNNDSGSVSWNNYFRYPQEENVAFILVLWEGGLSHSLSFSGISLLRKSSHSLVWSIQIGG